jgi:hypothetical protein
MQLLKFETSAHGCVGMAHTILGYFTLGYFRLFHPKIFLLFKIIFTYVFYFFGYNTKLT